MRTVLATVALAVLLGLGLYFQQRSGQSDQEAPEQSVEPQQQVRSEADDAVSLQPTMDVPFANESKPSTAPTSAPADDTGLLRSDSAFQGLFFAAERGLVDLAVELEKAQQRIDSGVPGGYFDLARVIENCALAEEAIALTTADGAPPLAEDTWSRELQQVAVECQSVLAALPEGQTVAEWQIENLRTAAERGDPLAALELAIDHTPGDQPYADVLALAQVVVQSDDYRGYFLIADFLAEFHDPAGADINEPVAMQWSLLGCRRSPLCEPEILEAQLALDFTPAQVEAFRNFAIEQEAKVERGEPLQLTEGWLPLDDK